MSYNIDWSTYGYAPGDSVVVTDNFLGQMTNLGSESQNSLGYVVIRLPKPLKSTVTSISCNTFSLNEIDDIDFAATSRTVTVLNTQSQSVGRNQTTLTAIVNTIAGDSNSIIASFKLKTGYSWGGAAQSYHAVMIRASSLTLTFN